MPVSYRTQKRIVESLGMAVVDGLGLTYSCADYPDWVRNMNGWPVEDIAHEVLTAAKQLEPPT
jgi:hypothetical protein